MDHGLYMKHLYSIKTKHTDDWSQQTMNIQKVMTAKERADAFQVRKNVFVSEQKVPEALEIDEHEDTAIHFICYKEDKPVGASRLRFIDNTGKLERLCVLASYRKQSIGKALIQKMEKEASHQQYKTVKLNAQTQAIGFYEALGYEVISDTFMDAGIPHQTMKKQL